MRIVLITQDNPLYINDATREFLERVPDDCDVIGCALLKASPFGKNNSFLQKIVKTIEVFGLKFFLYYVSRYVWETLTKPSISSRLRAKGISRVLIDGSINDEKNLDQLRNCNPDLLISLAGNQVFKKPLINLARFGCINLHTGYLPKYRGLMPTFWALKNGEDEIGVSVFFVNEGIDSGPIITQKPVKIINRNQKELIKLTKRIGVDCIIESIAKIKSSEYRLIANNDDDSSYFGFPTRDDVTLFLESGAKLF